MLIDIKKAEELILNEQIVALPTETVYGLAGDATSDTSCQKIFDTKRRPYHNPLIIHVSNLEEAIKYGEFNPLAIKVAKQFWPGPITIIVMRKKSNISEIATSGLETIALRVPAHKIIQEMLQNTKKPFAAPSANLYSKVSPTMAGHIIKNFKNVDVVDGGKSIFGIESTIIDCTSAPKILRHGFITQESLSVLLGIKVLFSDNKDSIIAPGMAKKHYSPSSPLKINSDKANQGEFAINFGDSNLGGKYSLNLSANGDLIEAASNLYDMLILADDTALRDNLESIVVAKIPKESIGLAINDKLERAAEK